MTHFYSTPVNMITPHNPATSTFKKPNVIVIIGPPCSGKTTYIRQNYPDAQCIKVHQVPSSWDTIVFEYGQNGNILSYYQLWKLFTGRGMDVKEIYRKKYTVYPNTVVISSVRDVKHWYNGEDYTLLERHIDRVIRLETIEKPNRHHLTQTKLEQQYEAIPTCEKATSGV